jgi:hypothetical protein
MKNLFFLFLINLTFSTIAQTSANISITVPSIALLDIAPNNTAFNLNVVAPTEAGSNVTINPANSTKWINFTSAVVSGTLPTGINLKLVVANYAGAGAGTLGVSAGTLFLSGTAQTVVNNIGGAFTGDGSNNGYNLNYSIEVANYTLLRSESKSFSIIYTMSDN